MAEETKKQVKNTEKLVTLNEVLLQNKREQRIEAEKEAEDYYYNFLKEKGWFDFVEDFVQPQWRVEGVRIDTELNYPMTIQAPYIRCENTPSLLGQIKSIRNL